MNGDKPCQARQDEEDGFRGQGTDPLWMNIFDPSARVWRYLRLFYLFCMCDKGRWDSVDLFEVAFRWGDKGDNFWGKKRWCYLSVLSSIQRTELDLCVFNKVILLPPNLLNSVVLMKFLLGSNRADESIDGKDPQEESPLPKDICDTCVTVCAWCLWDGYVLSSLKHKILSLICL